MVNRQIKEREDDVCDIKIKQKRLSFVPWLFVKADEDESCRLSRYKVTLIVFDRQEMQNDIPFKINGYQTRCSK